MHETLLYRQNIAKRWSIDILKILLSIELCYSLEIALSTP